MLRSCLLLMALSLPAAALHAQALPAPPSQPDAKEIASSPPLMERNLKTAERMVKEWDKNADGVVSAEEFQAAAADRFARQDKDGTGKITRPKPPGMPAMPPKGQILPNGQPLQTPAQPQPTKP